MIKIQEVLYLSCLDHGRISFFPFSVTRKELRENKISKTKEVSYLSCLDYGRISFSSMSLARQEQWEDEMIKTKEAQYLSCLAWTAKDRGVFPLLSFTFGLAPFCKRQVKHKNSLSQNGTVNTAYFIRTQQRHRVQLPPQIPPL